VEGDGITTTNCLPSTKLQSIAPMREAGIWSPKGPGPVIGEPTFHAIILAPGLDPAWFSEVGTLLELFHPV